MNRQQRRGARSARDTGATLRIIGGRFRGRHIFYDGNVRTRPMKNRVREAVFSLLGPEAVTGALAIDLFAGTGALALEALSRGAAEALALECNLTTVESLKQNARILGVEQLVKVYPGDTFFWASRLELVESRKWLVFCSPPYRLYQEQRQDLLDMIRKLWERAPHRSTFMLESDSAFDFTDLPGQNPWKRRSYPPAELGWNVKENNAA
jgi:16S rRNA (guanine(966)-N(2))-methyltransferase RsmD